ncbi:MAG: recombination-associated protein RdgC [Desulfobulbia bacterium]
MSLLSASVSITRYKVEGQLEAPVLETVAKALNENAISDIDDQAPEKVSGWTSFEKPYQPDFNGSSFVYGAYLIFALRIDKKAIPAKVVQKHFMIESARRLSESGRQYLSRNEKQRIKDHVIDGLSLKVPATPNVYDIIWNYEESFLWFFSNLKAANEELETLFSRSFDLTLVRMFPYTAAHFNADLADNEKDILLKLAPTNFRG